MTNKTCAYITERELKVLHMIDNDKMSFTEASKALGISLTTVCNDYRKAKSKEKYINMVNDPNFISFKDWCKLNTDINTYNALLRGKIFSYDKLLSVTEDELLSIMGVGPILLSKIYALRSKLKDKYRYYV